MPTIDEIIPTYFTACIVEGKSPNTVSSYRASLKDFRRVGKNVGLPDDLGVYTVTHVYGFLEDVRARGSSPAYRHRRHREVKAFFSWCKRMDLVADNVFAKVPLAKLEQQIIQPFSQSDITRVLESQDRKTHTGCLNDALFLFLLDTGVRHTFAT